MQNTLRFREEGEVVVVDVCGDLTMGQTSAALRAILRELAVAGYRSVLLNMAGVTHIDVDGIGDLVAGYTSLAGINGVLKLLNVTTPVKSVVCDSGLDAVFEMFDDETEATLSFYVAKRQSSEEILCANLPSETYIG